MTPINQVASISVEEARTLIITPWEKSVAPDIEKAILKSDLGLTPTGTGDAIRLPLPPLTEENRRDLIRHAKSEAENARVSIRNVRRDAIANVRELVREKESTEDEGRRGEELMYKARVLGAHDAIISATRVNAELFQLADEIGTVEVGKRADLVLVEGQPLDDIALVAEPDNVSLVMQGGTVVKDLADRLA